MLNKSVSNYFILCALLALVPQYVMRGFPDIQWWFYNHFTSYFGDIWYCWSNFLSKSFPYPREYPTGMQMFFRLIFLIPGVTTNYIEYAAIVCSMLALCALLTTYVLYKILKLQNQGCNQMWWLWILAPSYLFYGLLNLDFLTLITIVLAHYYFLQQRYLVAGAYLALGVTVKVFPIFLIPVYFFATPKTMRKQFIGFIIGVWCAFNLPAFILNPSEWLFPFQWQIQENFARTSHDGSWTWVLYKLFNSMGIGSLSGKLSLILFATSYFYFIRKYWHLPLSRKLCAVMLLFLLTDRVYSPQYNLYILPFLVLVDYKVNWKWFYLLEIPNLIQGFFMFFIKDHPECLQLILVLKYFAIIMLFRDNLLSSKIRVSTL